MFLSLCISRNRKFYFSSPYSGHLRYNFEVLLLLFTATSWRIRNVQRSRTRKIKEARKKIKILKIIQFLISLLYFLHFSFVRGGASITELSLRSKFSIGLFLVSVNIFSAQLWSETCKKFSPISYKECTLVREQDLHQPDYDYLPDILKAWIWLYVNAKK